jgi:hypothetical protein
MLEGFGLHEKQALLVSTASSGQDWEAGREFVFCSFLVIPAQAHARQLKDICHGIKRLWHR